jgi:hypothetical protein
VGREVEGRKSERDIGDRVLVEREMSSLNRENGVGSSKREDGEGKEMSEAELATVSISFFFFYFRSKTYMFSFLLYV